MNQTPGQKAAKLLTYAILIAGAVFILLPFVWMILTSVKPCKEVLKMPPVWIPSKIQWQNYVKAFKAVPFFTYLKNSILVTVMITSCELITTILAAYAFAQLEFRGKNLLFLGHRKQKTPSAKKNLAEGEITSRYHLCLPFPHRNGLTSAHPRVE